MGVPGDLVGKQMGRRAIRYLLLLTVLTGVIAPPVRGAGGMSNYDPPPFNPEVTKPVPSIFRIGMAKYDGRTLTLDVEVPGRGKLLLRIPTSCPTGEPADCRQRTPVVRRATEKGHLIIRRPMSIRLDSEGRLNVAARFERPVGVIVSSLRPKVHLVAGIPRR